MPSHSPSPETMEAASVEAWDVAASTLPADRHYDLDALMRRVVAEVAPILCAEAFAAGRLAGLNEARDRYEVLSDEQLGAVARRLAYFDGVNEAEWQEQASTRKRYGEYADEIVDTFLRVTAPASPTKGGESDGKH